MKGESFKILSMLTMKLQDGNEICLWYHLERSENCLSVNWPVCTDRMGSHVVRKLL